MNSHETNPLSDKKTVIGIALAMLFLIAWQKYLSVKYPNNPNPTQAVEQTKSNTAVIAPSLAPTTPSTIEQPHPSVAESTIEFGNDSVRFKVSNLGMGLSSFSVLKFLNAEKEPIVLGHSPEGLLFQMRWADQKTPIIFDVKDLGQGHFEGMAQEGGTTIKRTLTYDSSNNSFRSKVEITGLSERVKSGIEFILPETIRRNDNASWFFPSYDHQDFFIFHSGTKETINFNHSKTDIKKDFDSISIASVGNQYFSSALLDRSTVSPSLIVHSNAAQKTALAEIVYKPLQDVPTVTYEQVLYAGPKSIDSLKAIDPELAEIIDFGMLSFIAKPFLYVMKWFHSLVGNWGVAIILLTLTVRLIVLPLHLMSMKSMKGMQKIQPLLQQVREKYKDDAMAVHRETMALMKHHNANPISGCLPMLLQIPVFFALFRVVGSSVELYQSPFILWIHDLSAHDQFYVLPILLGLLMWLQQKLTPTNMDPAQAKVMQFLPLVFTAFMLKLPSGLTLYMVVSSLFGIIQQWYVLKDNKKTA